MYDVKMSTRRRPRSAARSEHFDLGAEPWSAGKRCIPCEERTSDRLGQRHVPGIVGGHILAELPHAGQERSGAVPEDGQLCQELDGRPPLVRPHRPAEHQAAEHLGDLQVEQPWGLHGAHLGLDPAKHRLGAATAEEEVDDD